MIQLEDPKSVYKEFKEVSAKKPVLEGVVVLELQILPCSRVVEK